MVGEGPAQDTLESSGAKSASVRGLLGGFGSSGGWDDATGGHEVSHYASRFDANLHAEALPIDNPGPAN